MLYIFYYQASHGLLSFRSLVLFRRPKVRPPGVNPSQSQALPFPLASGWCAYDLGLSDQ